MILQQYPFPEEEEEEANRVFGSGLASVELRNFKGEVVNGVADQRLKANE